MGEYFFGSKLYGPLPKTNLSLSYDWGQIWDEHNEIKIIELGSRCGAIAGNMGDMEIWISTALTRISGGKI